MVEATTDLPPDIRRRLAMFADRLERLRVDDLPMYAVRAIEPEHGRVVDEAELRAIESGRERVIEAARTSVADFIAGMFANAQYRPTMVGLNWGQSAGTTDDRVRIVVTLREAVTAIALWDVLDESDRAELLGAWANLID